MSESLLKEKVYSFFKDLSFGNFDKIEELFEEEAILAWGPYIFNGKAEIKQWATDLCQLFPFISFKEKKLEIENNKVNHEFLIAFLTQRGRKGWLPCEAYYDFQNEKILELRIKLLHGFLTVSKDEVDKVKPHASGY
jgi:hypothetical protein